MYDHCLTLSPHEAAARCLAQKGREAPRIAIGRLLTPMATESLSQVSAPAESEEGATLPLVLTTLAGEEIPSSKVRKYDRLEEFEDAVAECVPNVSQISTFGRTRLRPFEPTILKDPIWDTLRDCTRFNQKLRCPG